VLGIAQSVGETQWTKLKNGLAVWFVLSLTAAKVSYY